MAGLAISPIVAVFTASLYLPVSSKFFASGQDYPVRVRLIQLPDIWLRPPGDTSATLLLHQGDVTIDDVASALPGTNPAEEVIGTPTELIPQGSASLARPGLASLAAANTSSPAAGGIMPINFDIAGPADADATFQVSKTVIFNERSLGQLTVRIDEGARVYVSTAEMAGLFPEGLRPPQSWQEFVPLRQVRDAGIDLRYDPTADRMVLRDPLSN